MLASLFKIADLGLCRTIVKDFLEFEGSAVVLLENVFHPTLYALEAFLQA